MKHVQHVRGRWIARMTVPEELRQIVGKRELAESLGGDKRAADKLALSVLNRFHAILDEARETYAAGRPTLSSAAKAHHRHESELDDRERAAPSRPADLMRFSRSVYANRLRLALADKTEPDELEALIGYAVDDLIQKDLAPDVPRRVLLKALAEVQLENLAHAEDRDEGRIKPADPVHPLLTAPDPTPPSAAPATGNDATLWTVLEAFHKERNAGGRSLAPKTTEEHRAAVRMFEEHLSQTLPVRAIKKQHVLNYKQALLDTPTRYTLRFPGLTLPQAIKANKKRPVPYETLNSVTINMKWLSHLSSILEWGANNGFIDTNPAKGVRVDTGSAVHHEATRLPYTGAELKRMFAAPLFRDPAAYGTRQWAILLALYTGARSSSELARLTLDDIRKDQDVLVFDLSAASKNRRSKRLVPVHKDLLTLGLMQHVDRLRASGETRLFPEWQPEDKVNRWFLRTFLPSLGITDKTKVFHSFRHNLKTELVRSGCPRDLADLIAGHEDQSAAAVYIHDAPIKRMKEALDKVSFGFPVPTT